MDITFEFEGKTYKVPMSAYDVDCIVLPDRRVLKADSWLESYPPKPSNLHEVPTIFQASEPIAIALYMNGVVAQEVI